MKSRLPSKLDKLHRNNSIINQKQKIFRLLHKILRVMNKKGNITLEHNNRIIRRILKIKLN